jgi:hypothetical protein
MNKNKAKAQSMWITDHFSFVNKMKAEALNMHGLEVMFLTFIHTYNPWIHNFVTRQQDVE